MQLSDFDFDLPPELIAQHPLAERSASRLLDVNPQGLLTDRQVRDLPKLLNPGDLLIFNNSKVVPARLRARKPTGGAVELLVERVLDQHEAWVMLRASHKPQPGSRLTLLDHDNQPASAVTVLERNDAMFRLRFDDPIWTTLDRLGEIPLPPYMERKPDADDLQRYQTVYAQHPGSAAAPTAGLHFDQALLQALNEHGVQTAEVTLHVGAGTFLPVRTENLADHKMHTEWYQVPQATSDLVAQTRARGGKIVAVGTTSLRTLEAASTDDGVLQPGAGQTQLFILPGYHFKQVDRLMTNFHLPKSTLLMLVSAFAGPSLIRQAYAHAIEQRYRFFSYGDAMLLTRQPV